MKNESPERFGYALILVDLDGLHDCAFSESSWCESLRKENSPSPYRSIRVEICANLSSIEQISPRMQECFDGLKSGIASGFQVSSARVTVELAAVPIIPQCVDSLLLTLLKQAPDGSSRGPFTEIVIAARDRELHRAAGRILALKLKPTHSKIRNSQSGDLLLSRYVCSAVRSGWTRKTTPSHAFGEVAASPHTSPVHRIQDLAAAQDFSNLPLQIDWFRSPTESLARARAMPGLLSQVSATAHSVRGIGRAKRNSGQLGLTDRLDEVEIYRPEEQEIPSKPPNIVMPGPLGEGSIFLRWQGVDKTNAAVGLAVRVPMRWLKPAIEDAAQSTSQVLRGLVLNSAHPPHCDIDVAELLRHKYGPKRFGRVRLRFKVHSGNILAFDFAHTTATGEFPVPLPHAWLVDPAGKPMRPADAQIYRLAQAPAVCFGSSDIEAQGAQHPDGPGLIWRDPIEGLEPATTEFAAAPHQIVQVKVQNRLAIAINGPARVRANTAVRVAAIQDLPSHERVRFARVFRVGTAEASRRLLHFPLLVVC